MIEVAQYDLDAEKAVIGAILLDDTDEAVDAVRLTLSPDDFYGSANRKLYEALLEMQAPRDAVTVPAALKAKQLLDEVGGLPYLAECMAVVPSPSAAIHYAYIVRDKSKRRALIRICRKTFEAVTEHPDLSEVLANHERDLTALHMRRSDNRFYTPVDLLEEQMAQMAELQERPGTLMGVSSGLKGLDQKTGGFRKGHLVILAARPSMGKSALGIHFLMHCQVSALGFSLEQPRAEWTNRILASLGKIQLSSLESGQLDVEEKARYPRAQGLFNDIPMRIDDTPGLTVDDLCSRARRAHREQPLGLIVVDYLGKLRGRKGQSDYDRVTEASGQLKNLARELNIPVVALAQLNRGLESREEKRPMLSDLRDSGAIEQDADLVLFIYREQYYKPECDDPYAGEVNVAKARQGQTGTVHAKWFGTYQRWRDP